MPLIHVQIHIMNKCMSIGSFKIVQFEDMPFHKQVYIACAKSRTTLLLLNLVKQPQTVTTNNYYRWRRSMARPTSWLECMVGVWAISSFFLLRYPPPKRRRYPTTLGGGEPFSNSHDPQHTCDRQWWSSFFHHKWNGSPTSGTWPSKLTRPTCPYSQVGTMCPWTSWQLHSMQRSLLPIPLALGLLGQVTELSPITTNTSHREMHEGKKMCVKLFTEFNK